MENMQIIKQKLKEKGYQLEPFTSEDEHGLYRIFADVVKAGNQFPYECHSMEEFHRQFLSPQASVFVCRSIEGQVVGGFFLKANMPGRSNHIANAAYMIDPLHRGKGLGKLIVKASMHLAKDLGFHALQFNMVLTSNRTAVSLYNKLGFSIVGTVPKAYRSPDGLYLDGYIMHCSVEEIH